MKKLILLLLLPLTLMAQKPLVVHLTTDTYPSETYWVITKDSLGGDTIANILTGHYVNANTTYTDTVMVADSITDISFIIYDSYGDGMDGSYYVSVCEDTIISYPVPSFSSGLIHNRLIPQCAPNPPPIDTGACVNIKIEINIDQYPGETSWDIKDTLGNIMFFGGPYLNAIQYQPQIEMNCLPLGDFTFTIYDVYGDGMAGSLWGGNDGSYYVMQCGDTLVYGSVANFGNDSTHAFTSDTCVPPPPIPGCMDEDYLEFNPAATENDSSYCATLKILGCTDSTMFNYDPLANVTDFIDSCLYVLVMNDLVGNGWVGTHLIIKQGSSLDTFTLDSGYTDTQYVWLQSPSAITVVVDFDALTIGTASECGWSLTSPSGFVMYNISLGFVVPFQPWTSFTSCGNYCEPVVIGCIDSLAFNYAQEANTSSNFCYYNPGCLSPAYLAFHVDTANGVYRDYEDQDSCYSGGLAAFGCTDFLSFNYDTLANVNIGCLPVILGCMQPLAFNYEPLANTGDTCIAVTYGCMSSIALNYDSLANTDDGSCVGIVNGCIDTSSFNYDPTANVDDGSCIAIIYGCINPTQFNYDSLANTNNGSCIPYIYGCTDSTMFNYNPLANADNNSCTPFVFGCTDPSMLNYDPLSNTEDFTCIEFLYGCMEEAALNYDPLANTENNSCVTIVEGCMDLNAYNYSAEANVSDSNCLYSANCVTGPGEPYWLNDPCYAWVILVDDYCCDNEWDEVCQLTYDYCDSTYIGDIPARRSIERKLVSITDILGRPSKETLNTVLFYIYDDGTVEKRIIKQK